MNQKVYFTHPILESSCWNWICFSARKKPSNLTGLHRRKTTSQVPWNLEVNGWLSYITKVLNFPIFLSCHSWWAAQSWIAPPFVEDDFCIDVTYRYDDGQRKKGHSVFCESFSFKLKISPKISQQVFSCFII